MTISEKWERVPDLWEGQVENRAKTVIFTRLKRGYFDFVPEY